MASFDKVPRIIQEAIAKAYQDLIDQGVVITIPSELPKPKPPTPGSNVYALSATRAYPAANTLTYETAVITGASYSAVCVVRAETGYTGPGPFIIEGRNFRNDNGNCIHVYMPEGQEVIIRNCNLAGKSAADLINVTDNSRVTVYNCTGTADGTQPIGTARARFFYAFRPRKAKVYNNYLRNTAGGKVEYWSDGATATDTLVWSKNRIDNICGGTGGDYRQGIQIQHVNSRPGMLVEFNQIINQPGLSRVEDNINIGETSGTPDSYFRVCDNFISGAFPANPTDSGFTGTGITTDAGGPNVSPDNQPSYILAEGNIISRTMNAAMNIAAGHDIIYRKNKIVIAGQNAQGIRYNSVGNAVSIFKGQPTYSDTQFDRNSIVENDIRVGLGQPYYVNTATPLTQAEINAGRNNYPGPNSKALVAGNTLNTYAANATVALEDALLVEWQTKLTANKVEVGVLTKPS